MEMLGVGPIEPRVEKDEPACQGEDGAAVVLPEVAGEAERPDLGCTEEFGLPDAEDGLVAEVACQGEDGAARVLREVREGKRPDVGLVSGILGAFHLYQKGMSGGEAGAVGGPMALDMPEVKLSEYGYTGGSDMLAKMSPLTFRYLVGAFAERGYSWIEIDPQRMILGLLKEPPHFVAMGAGRDIKNIADSAGLLVAAVLTSISPKK